VTATAPGTWTWRSGSQLKDAGLSGQSGAFETIPWAPDDFSALGVEVQRRNPWRHPLSIHPSARLDWHAPHNCQSSRPFHGETWLDHHWLQTGQSVDRLFNIVTRLAENRALMPTRADLTPPHASCIGDKRWIVYIPRGNEKQEILLSAGTTRSGTARWFYPRRGELAGPALVWGPGTWVLPPRPAPADDDWLLIAGESAPTMASHRI